MGGGGGGNIQFSMCFWHTYAVNYVSQKDIFTITYYVD